MWRIVVAFSLSFDIAAACDAVVFWGEKGVGNSSTSSLQPDVISEALASWPKSMRKHVESRGAYARAQDGWPTGADATSYSHVLTWEKLDPAHSGDVFISQLLDEGCGGGYIGAQIRAPDMKMYADWAIWDGPVANNTQPLSKTCIRYDGEGHGTQCGAPDGLLWELNTPYTFNVSIVHGNASGAHLKSTITNGKSGEVIELGEIWTGQAGYTKSCSRLIVGGYGFQEYYVGGNFTNIASVQGPIFRGVKGHAGDVMPTNYTDCYEHNSLYKMGLSQYRNETTHHCIRPECPTPKITYLAGQVPIPDAVIPPWDNSPAIKESTDCWMAELTGLDGGMEPEYWGMPIMDDRLHLDDQRKSCCGYCLADPECMGAQLYGDRCSLRHVTNTSAPFKTLKNIAHTTAVLPMRSHPLPPADSNMRFSFV